jgi:lipid-A-disaccharide synthase
VFLGHPYFDEVRRQQYDEAFLAQFQRQSGPLVAILPGSRTQEVTSNLPWFVRAAERIWHAVPNVRFAVASFKPHQAEIARRALAGRGLPIEVHVGRTPELIRLADCCMAVSGSVSLELLYQAKPTVILYWITRTAFFVQSYFRKVKYITLVNLLATDDLYPRDVTPFDPAQPDADRVPYPEYLTCEDKSAQVAAHVIEWLRDPARRAARVGMLEQIRAQVSAGGASARAAEYILRVLAERRAPAPRPHFLGEHAASHLRVMTDGDQPGG